MYFGPHLGTDQALKPRDQRCFRILHCQCHNFNLTYCLMHEEGYSSSGWHRSEPSDPTSPSSYRRPSLTSHDDSTESTGHGHPLHSGSPQPRMSSDSGGISSGSRWRDTPTALSDSQEIPPPNSELVETAFDENVLRALCEMDVCSLCIFNWNTHLSWHGTFNSQCGVPLLLDRIKQSMVSCRASSLLVF